MAKKYTDYVSKNKVLLGVGKVTYKTGKKAKKKLRRR